MRDVRLMDFSDGARFGLKQTVAAILAIVQEHYTLTGSFPTVDQILDKLLSGRM